MTKRKAPEDIMQAGRKPLYSDPQEMEQAIDHYLNSIRRRQPVYVARKYSPRYTYEQIAKMPDDEQNKKEPALDLNGDVIMETVWVKAPHEGDIHRAIGILSRDCWNDYGQNPIFSDTVGRAKKIVEDYYSAELANRTGNTAGLQFVMGCCYGWKNIQYSRTEMVDRLEDDFI